MAAKSDASHFTKAFNTEDTAVVLIDHQIGTCGWVHSIEKELLEKNVNILATFAAGMKMPLVLTSSMSVSLKSTPLDLFLMVFFILSYLTPNPKLP